jgi:hypothetical protein
MMGLICLTVLFFSSLVWAQAPDPVVPAVGVPDPAVPVVGAPDPAVPAVGAPDPAVPAVGAPDPDPTSGSAMKQERDIGVIKTLTGEASILRGSESLPVQLGTFVQLLDRIQTGSSGSVGITFVDQTRIAIGPDTQFTIDDFAFNPREKQLSFIASVTKGIIQCLSGTIAKLAPDAVAIKIPSGTLGVRGTRFVVQVL